MRPQQRLRRSEAREGDTRIVRRLPIDHLTDEAVEVHNSGGGGGGGSIYVVAAATDSCLERCSYYLLVGDVDPRTEVAQAS